jgi:hypothetical protein
MTDDRDPFEDARLEEIGEIEYDGPHVHVYVGTERGDECEICGQVIDDEWAYWNWVDREHDWYLDLGGEAGGA